MTHYYSDDGNGVAPIGCLYFVAGLVFLMVFAGMVLMAGLLL